MIWVQRSEDGDWSTAQDPGGATRAPCLVIAFPDDPEDSVELSVFVADQEVAAGPGVHLLVIEEFVAVDGREFELAECENAEQGPEEASNG